MKRVSEIQAIQYNGNIVKDHKGKIKVHEASEFETTYREVEDDYR